MAAAYPYDRSEVRLCKRKYTWVSIVWWQSPQAFLPFAVQYGGGGHYYKTLAEALEYISNRWRVYYDEHAVMMRLLEAEVTDPCNMREKMQETKL